MSRIAHENIEQLHINSFYTFFMEHFSQDYSFVGHIHNMMECQYVLQGSICASVDEMYIIYLQAKYFLFNP